MDLFKIYYNNKENVKKIIAIMIIVILLGLMNDFLEIALLTAIQVILTIKISDFIYKTVLKEKYLSSKTINILSFMIIMSIIIFCIFNIFPNIVSLFSDIKDINLDEIINLLNKKHLNFIKKEYLYSEVKQIGILSLKLFNQIEKTGVSVFMSFILAFFYLLNKEEIRIFMRKFENCKCSFYYNFCKVIAKKFMDSFIRILEAQMIIAFINAVVSVIMLAFMGFDNFLVLGVMIFILSLIPVIGTFISLVPLSIMAYQIGGFIKVISVCIMIAIVHALESYVLNPKIMSKTIKMPEFFTFLILLISEKYIGTWGLIIGLPLFMFILDILGVETIANNKTLKDEKR